MKSSEREKHYLLREMPLQRLRAAITPTCCCCYCQYQALELNDNTAREYGPKRRPAMIRANEMDKQERLNRNASLSRGPCNAVMLLLLLLLSM